MAHCHLPSAIDDLLECGMCLETFDADQHKPKVLDKCQHIFCLPCLDLLLLGRGSARGVVCPNCKQYYAVRDGVDADHRFSDHLLAKQIVDRVPMGKDRETMELNQLIEDNNAKEANNSEDLKLRWEEAEKAMNISFQALERSKELMKETLATEENAKQSYNQAMKANVMANNNFVKCGESYNIRRGICDKAKREYDATMATVLNPKTTVTASTSGNNISNGMDTLSSASKRSGTSTKKVGDPEWVLARVDSPSGISFFDNGNFAVSSLSNHCINIYSKDGCLLSSIGSKGNGPCKFNEPSDLAINKRGEIVVADFKNQRLQLVARRGAMIKIVKLEGYPCGVCIDNRGTTYVTTYSPHTVVVFNEGWRQTNTFRSNMFKNLQHLDYFSKRLYISDLTAKVIHVVDCSTGAYIQSFGNDLLACPWGVQIRPTPQATLLVGDGESVLPINTYYTSYDGTMIGLSRGLEGVRGICLKFGDVFICDSYNNRIVRVSVDGELGNYVSNTNMNAFQDDSRGRY